MRGRLSSLMMLFATLAFAAASVLSAATAGPLSPTGGQEPSAILELAQATPGSVGFSDQQRCITIRKCQYQRGGSFRGCISTYSCRICRMVPSRCDIGGRTQNCQELRCSWG